MIYDKRDYSNLDIVNLSFLNDDIPRSTSYGARISQIIRLAGVCNQADYKLKFKFNERNTILIKMLTQNYKYYKLCISFCNLLYRETKLVEVGDIFCSVPHVLMFNLHLIKHFHILVHCTTVKEHDFSS